MTYPVGSFFLTPVSGWAGRLIRFGQWACRKPCIYGHAGMITDPDGTTMEAQPGGARPGNVANYPQALICDGPIQRWLAAQPHEVSPGVPRQIDWAQVEAFTRSRVRQYALMERDTPYSVLDYVALACLHFHLPSTWVRNRVRSSGHAICSQLVDLIYADAGIHLWDDPNKWPGDVMPADLWLWDVYWKAAP